MSAAQGPIGGEKKAIVIAASRAYHEAQNALLESIRGTACRNYLFSYSLRLFSTAHAQVACSKFWRAQIV